MIDCTIDIFQDWFVDLFHDSCSSSVSKLRTLESCRICLDKLQFCIHIACWLHIVYRQNSWTHFVLISCAPALLWLNRDIQRFIFVFSVPGPRPRHKLTLSILCVISPILGKTTKTLCSTTAWGKLWICLRKNEFHVNVWWFLHRFLPVWCGCDLSLTKFKKHTGEVSKVFCDMMASALFKLGKIRSDIGLFHLTVDCFAGIAALIPGAFHISIQNPMASFDMSKDMFYPSDSKCTRKTLGEPTLFFHLSQASFGCKAIHTCVACP